MRLEILLVMLLAAGTAACSPGTERKSIDSADAPSEPASPEAGLFRISKGQVGFVQKGMRVAALKEQVPRQQRLSDTTLHLEGQAYEAYLLLPRHGNSGLLIEQQCNPDCKIWRMRVFGKQYKTAEGIGVGSTIGEAQRFYPIKYVSLGEAGLVAVSEQAGLSFVLEASELPQDHPSRLSAAAIPPNLPVKQIIVY